jgi:hypothetical protein
VKFAFFGMAFGTSFLRPPFAWAALSVKIDVREICEINKNGSLLTFGPTNEIEQESQGWLVSIQEIGNRRKIGRSGFNGLASGFTVGVVGDCHWL